jgi:hypothetical protein
MLFFCRVQRLNSKSKPRPIIATFAEFKDREIVRSSVYKLIGSPFGLGDQYPSDVLPGFVPNYFTNKQDRIPLIVVNQALMLGQIVRLLCTVCL